MILSTQKNDQIGLKDICVAYPFSWDHKTGYTHYSISKYYMFSSSIYLLVIAFALVMKCGHEETSSEN